MSDNLHTLCPIPLLRDAVFKCATSELVRGIAQAAMIEFLRHKLLHDAALNDAYDEVHNSLAFLAEQAKRYKAELDSRFPAPSSE